MPLLINKNTSRGILLPTGSIQPKLISTMNSNNSIYTRIYVNLVNSRKHLKEQWKIKHSGLTRHRILPGHQGGTYEDSNCTYLTHREHIIAHWLLWKINGIHSDLNAHYMMKGTYINPVYWPGIAEKISAAKTGVPRPDMKGKVYFGANPERIKQGIEKMRLKKTGMKIPNYPKDRKSSPCSEQKRLKIQKARLKTKERFINMTDKEFDEWLLKFPLYNKNGKKKP